MRYKNIEKSIFMERPNRFIANVEINGKAEVVHVKNTGRCKEILRKGCTVYLERSDNPNRSTKYDLVAAEKERENSPALLINIDSQAPNKAAEEWLCSGKFFSPDAVVKREVKYRNSRFDFYIEDKGKKAFLEVKGVTQEYSGKAMFPDAPTERGIKHIEELIECKKEGYDAYILFVIQMKEITSFTPNEEIHKAFADTLRKAQKNGVKIIAMDCKITPDSMEIDENVPVLL